jgi:hypothetical protein
MPEILEKLYKLGFNWTISHTHGLTYRLTVWHDKEGRIGDKSTINMSTGWPHNVYSEITDDMGELLAKLEEESACIVDK